MLADNWGNIYKGVCKNANVILGSKSVQAWRSKKMHVRYNENDNKGDPIDAETFRGPIIDTYRYLERQAGRTETERPEAHRTMCLLHSSGATAAPAGAG